MKLKFTLSSGARQDRLKRLLFSNSTAVRRAANKQSTRKVLKEDVAKGAEKEVKNLGDPSSPSSSSSNVSVNKGSQKSYPQSFDLLRSLSSSWRWSSSSPSSSSSVAKNSGESVQNGSLKTDGPDAKNEHYRASDSVAEKWKMVLRRENVDENKSEEMLGKLIETTSGISKVAKLAILNEELAKNPNFLDPLQKGRLAKHLLKKKDEIPGKRFQESVRCTFNLLGIPEKPRGSGIRILSIDGGGTRGLVPLEILNFLEKRWSSQRKATSAASQDEQTGKEKMMETFIQQFDLVCGVSTGSIVVFMTAVAGINFPTSIQLYRKMAAEIFKRSSIMGVGSTLYGSSWYDTYKWAKHLQSYERSFDPLFMASKDKNTPMVCAVAAVTNDDLLKPLVFRSYNFLPFSKSRYLGTSAAENWQAVRASTAAPFYFDSYKYLDKELQDGGLLLNNPTALAIHEARALWPNEELQLVLSLGTGLQTSAFTASTSTATAAKNDNTSSNHKNTYIDKNFTKSTSASSVEDRKVVTSSSEQGSSRKGSAAKSEGSSSGDGGAVSGWRRTFSHFFDSVTDTEIIHTTLKDLLPRGVYYRFNPRLNNKVFMDEFRPEKLDGLREETLKYMEHHSSRVDRFVHTINKQRSTTAKLRDLWFQTSLEDLFTKTKPPR